MLCYMLKPLRDCMYPGARYTYTLYVLYHGVSSNSTSAGYMVFGRGTVQSTTAELGIRCLI